MKSIRIYLIIALLSTITLGNFVAAVYGYRSSMAAAQALLDTQLADTIALIQTMQPSKNAVVNEPSDRLAFQIWTADGVLVQRSANSSENPITRLEDGYRDENFSSNRWRVLSRFDAEKNQWILVAEPIDIRIELADSIILKSILPIIVGLPLIVLIVWLVVGNGLSLIQKLARELGTKRADDLSLLSTANPPVELAPVVDAVNDLLRRLTESVKRERRFPADAAHELRTPLSAVKVHVHNLKSEFPQHAERLRILDKDLGRLGHLIEQMMLLYRTTPEHYQAQMRPIDLHTLAQSVITELYDEIDARQQAISLSGATQTINGDEPSLVILLRNLILNASKYSPAGASIEVQVEHEAFGVRLGVKDTGPGVPLAEINRILDRFYRVGGDRHGSDVEGCGLGLSIVKHIADLHHANISLTNNDDGPGLSADVFFPNDIGASDAKRDIEK